jgi:hypothetical protein
VSITRPCYCNRDDAARSIDFKDGIDVNAALDRALQSSAESIEGHFHRVFYPRDTTYKWDWPNTQMAPPWKLYFNQWDLVSATQVQSPPGTTIPLSSVIFRPVNRKPGWPFTYMELDRSTVSAFSAGPTPQLAIQVTGTWGFTADSDQVTTLAANALTGDATITVSDGSRLGAGDLAIIGTERLVVTSKKTAATGLTQSGQGCTTAAASDNTLATTGSGSLNAGEVLLLDQEQMLVTDITNSVVTVMRSWNGTMLAQHSAATVYAYRLLGVLRGQLGTTAAGYSAPAAVSKHRVPSMIRDLGIGETTNRILQEGSGYARTVGSGDSAMPASGLALADLWDECRTVYGRKARIRAV